MTEIFHTTKAALNEALRREPSRPGDQLHNGAMIVKIAEVSRDEDRAVEYVILAVHKGFQPYVTWRYVIGIDQLATGGFRPMPSYCWAGDYFRDLNEALGSFDGRVATNRKETVDAA